MCMMFAELGNVRQGWAYGYVTPTRQPGVYQYQYQDTEIVG